MNQTAWQVVAKALEAEGIEYVFGLPGNPQHLIEDLHAHTDIRFVLVRDEPSAVACAYAYARTSGRPGVCFSNPGPGITNLVTGLLETTSGSLPVVALCNGVVEEHNGMGAFQELDAVALMRPVTKWAVRITDPAKTPWTIARAFQTAVNGRPGAVFVEIASDVALKSVAMPPYRPHPGRHRYRPEPAALEAAAELIAAAERPLMLCGSGAVWSEAFEAVRALSHTAGMPVFTTPGGRGIMPEDDALAMGQVGLYFTEVGKRYFDTADLVLSVGSRLEAFSTVSWQAWPQQARLVQLDIEPEAIGLNIRPETALVGDASLGLAELHERIASRIDPTARERRVAAIAEAKSAYLAWVQADAQEPHTPIRPRQVVATVNDVFGRGTVLVKENGGSDLWCYYWPYYKVLDVGDCVPMAEQTAMGMGVIGCIGAKLARPDKKVVCIAGDGATIMAMKELATAAEWKLGVTWVVLDNRSLGWVQYTQVLKGQTPVATDFEQPTDLVMVAEAQGCRGIRVERPEELVPALESALDANRAGVPALVSVAIARHDYPPHFVEVHRRKIGH